MVVIEGGGRDVKTVLATAKIEDGVVVENVIKDVTTQRGKPEISLATAKTGGCKNTSYFEENGDVEGNKGAIAKCYYLLIN